MSFFRKITAALAVASIAVSMAVAPASAADVLKITFDSKTAVIVEDNSDNSNNAGLAQYISGDKTWKANGVAMKDDEFWIVNLGADDVFYINADKAVETDLPAYGTITLDAAAESSDASVEMYIGDEKVADLTVTKLPSGAGWADFSDFTADFKGAKGVVKFVVTSANKLHIRSITFSSYEAGKTVDATVLDEVFKGDGGDCALAYYADFKLDNTIYNDVIVTWQVKDVGTTKVEKSYGSINGKDSSKYGLVVTGDEDEIKGDKPIIQATFNGWETKEIIADADTYTSGWSGEVDKNYNSGDEKNYIRIQEGSTKQDPKYGFFSFDLTGIDTSRIKSAKLVLSKYGGQAKNYKEGIGYSAYIYNGTFDETTLTWNKMEEDSNSIGTTVIGTGGSAADGVEIELDKSALTAGTVSLVVKQNTNTENQYFVSKEGTSDDSLKPHLVLEVRK